MIDERKLLELLKQRIASHEKDAAEIDGYAIGCNGEELLLRLADEVQAIIEVIEEQQKVNEWIPCSERLPEKDERYLCWLVFSLGSYACTRKFAKDLHQIDKNDFPKDIGAGFYYYDSDFGYIKEADVVAWMPLPPAFAERK